MLDVSTSNNSTIVRSKKMARLTRAALQTAYLLSEDLGTSLAERLFTTPKRHPRPAREQAILATARPFTIDVRLRAPRRASQQTQVAAWRWGHGPSVLLVHGWEGRGAQLGAFVEPLVGAGMSVVAFDAPAHGDSPGHGLYLTDHADAIADVAAAIGPVHATIAHSFGAAATLLAHARGGVDAPRNVMIAPNVIIEASVRRFARAVGLDDADRLTFEHQLAVHSGVSIDALRLDRLVGVRDAGLLVVHDRDDREVSCDHADQLAMTWPNAQLRITEALGHRRILRDPDVVAQGVEFVGQGVVAPASDLVREVDRYFRDADSFRS